MSYKNEKLTIFALEGSAEYDLSDDLDKIKAFEGELGYAFLLTFSGEMISLANRLKDIKSIIDILEEWKTEDYFKINKTTYKIDWHYSHYKKEKTVVTLPQAKKLYKETKVKYDILLSVIEETYRIHGTNKDRISEPKEFLTEIEF